MEVGMTQEVYRVDTGSPLAVEGKKEADFPAAALVKMSWAFMAIPNLIHAWSKSFSI